MVRHIRDPVTGRCKVCEKDGGIHGPQTVVHQDDPNGRPTWDSATKKVIYMNHFNNPQAPVHGDGIYVHNSPAPRRSPSPKPRSPDSGFSGDSTVSASRVHMYPAPAPPPPQPQRGPVTVFHQYHGNQQPMAEPEPYPRERYRPRERTPPRRERERTPSPQGGCCGGRGNSKGYGRGRDVHNKGYYDKYGRPYDGRVDPEVGGKMRHGYYGRGGNTGGNWGRRRCCAVLWALLLLLLLAALAVAIYFIVKAIKDEERANDPARNYPYPRGRYVNGVWVVPVTSNPRDTYFVYGADTPCNPYNNNTETSNNETYPNCDTVTLRYELNNNYTTTGPTTILVVTTDAANTLSFSPFFPFLPTLLFTSLCLFFRFFSTFNCDWPLYPIT